jgi:dienelactone hydrolase
MAEVSSSGRQEVQIPFDGNRLLADLAVPSGAQGIVIFAHGSGSGRRSPRNRAVAEVLQRQGIATLLLDLLTAEEARQDERDLSYRFQIPFLGDRLVAAVDWVLADPLLRSLRIGLYGASTGGAAALLAAAARPEKVQALVLRGARSDLAAEAFLRVKAPTLLLVGGLDPPILEIARETSATV